jgi:hypothetical protein
MPPRLMGCPLGLHRAVRAPPPPPPLQALREAGCPGLTEQVLCWSRWNERPQGSTDYVVQLRHELTKQGFSHVGITVEATWEELIRKALTNTTFRDSVVAGSAHYPCNATTNSQAALNASLKWWAGEDNTGGLGTQYGELQVTRGLDQ